MTHSSLDSTIDREAIPTEVRLKPDPTKAHRDATDAHDVLRTEVALKPDPTNAAAHVQSPTPGSYVESNEGPAVERAREVVAFPHGLPGFEACRSFVVFSADAAPFQWLTSVEGPPASFLTVDPRRILPTFRQALGGADLERLGADGSTPLLWLAIVLVEADGTLAANLRAPIVINPINRIGQQVMPHDSLYPLRHVIVPSPDR